MSVAAAGGGMSGSDDDNGGGEKKKGKEISEILDFLPSTDEDTDDDGDEMDAKSKAKRGSPLDSMASVEASLPMSGLSGHYHGKSKSFGNLTELGIEDTKDVGKKEHPTNRKRRLLIAHEYRNKKLKGGASSNITHASSIPTFLPDHRNNEDEDEEEYDFKNDHKKGNDDDKNQEDEDGN